MSKLCTRNFKDNIMLATEKIRGVECCTLCKKPTLCHGASIADRTCYMMELDPKYVDVIRKRYAKFISPDNELPENWEELTPAIA